jgi:hypothetical protein
MYQTNGSPVWFKIAQDGLHSTDPDCTMRPPHFLSVADMIRAQESMGCYTSYHDSKRWCGLHHSGVSETRLLSCAPRDHRVA